MRIWVTPDGCPVPMRLWWRDYYAWQYDSGYDDENGLAADLNFVSYGEVEPGLERKLHRMVMEEMSPYVPPVPQWLAESPPPNCSLLPSGEVITSGELGTGEKSKWRPGGVSVVPDDTFFRYSADGELLDQVEPGGYWWEMYFAGWDEVVERYDIPDTCFSFSDDGAIEIFDDNMNRQVIYKYTGEELPLDYDTDADEEWVHLYGRDLPVLYEIQQQANGHEM